MEPTPGRHLLPPLSVAVRLVHGMQHLTPTRTSAQLATDTALAEGSSAARNGQRRCWPVSGRAAARRLASLGPDPGGPLALRQCWGPGVQVAKPGGQAGGPGGRAEAEGARRVEDGQPKPRLTMLAIASAC